MPLPVTAIKKDIKTPETIDVHMLKNQTEILKSLKSRLWPFMNSEDDWNRPVKLSVLCSIWEQLYCIAWRRWRSSLFRKHSEYIQWMKSTCYIQLLGFLLETAASWIGCYYVNNSGPCLRKPVFGRVWLAGYTQGWACQKCHPRVNTNSRKLSRCCQVLERSLCDIFKMIALDITQCEHFCSILHAPPL